MEAWSLKFTANFGGIIKQCELVRPYGGGDDLQIKIDRWHHGTLAWRNGEWKGYLGLKSELTTADIMVLAEMVNDANANGKGPIS